MEATYVKSSTTTCTSVCDLQPNGRFELHQKICLSASSYHPELWQPSWSSKPCTLTWFLFVPHLFDVFCAPLLNGTFLQVRWTPVAAFGTLNTPAHLVSFGPLDEEVHAPPPDQLTPHLLEWNLGSKLRYLSKFAKPKVDGYLEVLNSLDGQSQHWVPRPCCSSLVQKKKKK